MIENPVRTNEQIFDGDNDLRKKDPVSRRNILRQGLVLSLAIPGLGVALSGCDRNTGSTNDQGAAGTKNSAGAVFGMDQDLPDSDMFAISGETIAAAASAKMTTFDPALPPFPTADTLRLHWQSKQTPIRISPGAVISAWTFENDVPGPIAHCRVGDTVEFTLTNDTYMPHSMDFHAAQINPKSAYRSVSKGQSVSFTFKPRRAGAFLYHCGTPPMLLHIGAGMYGAMIVSPRESLPPAREYVLVQGEYYVGKPVSNVYPLDYAKMLSVTPDLVVFNGRPDQYMAVPVRAKVGERVRFWVVNAGPSLPCAFHVIGQQFETVYLGEPPNNAIHGVQTFEVAPGGGMVFDVMCDIPGEFNFLNHAAAYAQKGAMGTLKVEA